MSQTSLKKSSSVSKQQSVKVLSVDEEMSANSASAIAKTQEEAKGALESLTQKFNDCDKNIASSSGNATREMLEQGRIAVLVEKRYAKGSLDAYYKDFREQTNTISASKWSQYKRIGRVADVLEPYADRLPSGWSVLSSLAVLFDHKFDKWGKDLGPKYQFSVEDLLKTPIKFPYKKSTREKLLTPTSTQTEVRTVVNILLGKQKTEKEVLVAPSYRPALNIALDKINPKTFDAELAELGNAIANLSKKFAWFTVDPSSFGRAGLNSLAARQVKQRVGAVRVRPAA